MDIQISTALEQELTAREVAVGILTHFDKTHRIDDSTLNSLTGQERQQANEIIQGILRRKMYLDFIIGEYSHVAVSDMEAKFKNILRLGIYELLFMDGTPDYAAINEAVELAKTSISNKSGDLANAILRKVQREVANLPKPAFEDRTQLVAVTFSHPEWLVKRWVERYGEREAFLLMQANNKRPNYFLRVNNLKTQTENFKLRMSKAGVEFVESEWLPGFFQVQTLSDVIKKGWFEKGLCQVQDIGAGFAPWIIDPQPGESIIDLCAAPGTKTIFLADMMTNKGTILSVDINAKRIERIAENAEACGADIVKIKRADAIEESFKLADAVLLDAPCTGTGVLAKRADLRWKRTPEELEEITKTQWDLLDAAANMVSKNGRLVYSTCSIEPEENMDQINRFLQEYDNFVLEDLSGYLPEEVLIEGGKAYQTLPHVHHCDGHFGVLLRRVH